jgi:signal transduction histidine kinase
MRHRVRALGGTFDVSSSATGGVLDVRIPAARALRPVAETEPL